MMLAIVAASMTGTVIDWSLWSALFRPWDYPPGFGSLAPAGLLGAGSMMLMYGARRHAGQGWSGDPALFPPPFGLLLAAGGSAGPSSVLARRCWHRVPR